MPLHMTKVAYGAQTLEEVRGWFGGSASEKRLTTRYLPKRHEEMVGGSLYWILKHQLIGRSPILRFEEAANGRTAIVIANRLIETVPLGKRAHQGWRYLAAGDAPADLAGGVEGDALPGELVSELARIGLV